MPDGKLNSRASGAPLPRQRRKYRQRQDHYPYSYATLPPCGFCGSYNLVKSGGTIKQAGGTIFSANTILRRERCQDCGKITKVVYRPEGED